MGQLANKIWSALEDVSSLEVKTFTGTASATAGADFDFSLLLKPGDNVTLVAYTKFSFDGDVSQFQATNASASHVQAHKDAIAAGQATRQGLLDIATKILT